MRIRSVLGIALLMTAHFALAQSIREGVFGLNWGMTPEMVRKAGISISKTKGEANFEFFTASSVPKPMSDMETYILTFSDGYLVKISAVGKDITNDPTGTSGKSRFDATIGALRDKYGTPKNYQSVGAKLYREVDEFYECLRYAGCGQWAATFETPGKDIAVELRGLRRGVGFLRVTVEAEPEFTQALEKAKALKRKADADAL